MRFQELAVAARRPAASTSHDRELERRRRRVADVDQQRRALRRSSVDRLVRARSRRPRRRGPRSRAPGARRDPPPALRSADVPRLRRRAVGERAARRAALARRRARRGARHRGAARTAARRRRRVARQPKHDAGDRVVRRLDADWHAARDRHDRAAVADPRYAALARAARGRRRAAAVHALGASPRDAGAPALVRPPVAEAAATRSTISAQHRPTTRCTRSGSAPSAPLRRRGDDPGLRQARATVRAGDRRRAGRARRAPGRGRRAHAGSRRPRASARRPRRSRPGCSPSSRREPRHAARARVPGGLGGRRARSKLRRWL